MWLEGYADLDVLRALSTCGTGDHSTVRLAQPTEEKEPLPAYPSGSAGSGSPDPAFSSSAVNPSDLPA